MMRYTLAGVLLTVCLASCGCTSFGKMPTMPWEEQEPEYKTPTKMVVTWKDAVRYNPNDPPTRGFGGRIHFYDESNKPIRVKGTLTVYGYNDSADRELDIERPDRKYVFKDDTFDTHYSMSKLGHSYSFWVPWDLAGGPEAEITLAPFFTSETGQVVMSEQSAHLLPGVARRDKNNQSSPSDSIPGLAENPNTTIAPVAYQQNQIPLGGGSADSASMRTTTIHVPHSMHDKLKAAAFSRPLGHIQPKPSVTPTPASATQQPPQAIPSRPEPAPSVPWHLTPGNQIRSQQLQPGVNLQSFRPQFNNATGYSEFLANGGQTMAGSQPHGLPGGSQPTTLQAPSQQSVPTSGNHLPYQQRPTVWPPGLPGPR